jgi:hypothetical protein
MSVEKLGGCHVSSALGADRTAEKGRVARKTKKDQRTQRGVKAKKEDLKENERGNERGKGKNGRNEQKRRQKASSKMWISKSFLIVTDLFE